MEDTLRTTAVGFSGHFISGLHILPDLILVLVGLATLVYLVIKIKKEMK